MHTQTDRDVEAGGAGPARTDSPVRMILRSMVALSAMLLAGCAATPVAPDRAARVEEVRAAETAFARTMADRDLAAFASFVADDAVFVNGNEPLRGKPAILAHWQRFFAGPQAPFSWTPRIVEVLGSGELAYSEGPVISPQGELIATYFSTWRRDSRGAWKVVLDNGYVACRCAPK